MKPSGLCDLEFTDYLGAGGEPRMRAESPSTGLVLDANCSNLPDASGAGAHTTTIVSKTDDARRVHGVGFDFEVAYYPILKTMPGVSTADRQAPADVHQTGGANRNFGPRIGCYLMRPRTQGDIEKALDYMRAWVTAEITKRPLAHTGPRDFREDLSINKGTPYAWSSETKLSGWNSYDVAHALWQYEALLGLAGDHMGTYCFVQKWSWIAKAHPPETNFWHNQERAVAGMIENGVLATELGLGRGDDGGEALDKLFGGRLPKRMLNDYCTRLCDNYDAWQAEWQRDLDDRKLPILAGGKDWRGYGPQFQGQYGPMNAQLVYALAKAVYSGLLRPDVAPRVLAVLQKHALALVRMATKPGSAMMAFSCGTTDFNDEQTVLDGIAEAKLRGFPPPGADPIEAVPVVDRWRVRSVRELQDVEMMGGALGLAYKAVQKVGATLDPEVTDYLLLALEALPKPESTAYNQSSKAYSRYLSPAYMP